MKEIIAVNGKGEIKKGIQSVDITGKMTIHELRHAIWTIRNGSAAVGGLDIMEYRDELRRRGYSPMGYHEFNFDAPHVSGTRI